MENFVDSAWGMMEMKNQEKSPGKKLDPGKRQEQGSYWKVLGRRVKGNWGSFVEGMQAVDCWGSCIHSER